MLYEITVKLSNLQMMPTAGGHLFFCLWKQVRHEYQTELCTYSERKGFYYNYSIQNKHNLK